MTSPADKAPPPHRTQIPNIVDDLGLDPYERALYVHYKRVCGENQGAYCYEAVKTTAHKVKMSTGQVSEARKQLTNRGLILVQDSRPVVVTVANIWELNTAFYKLEHRPDVDGWSVEQVKLWLHDMSTDVHTVNASSHNDIDTCSPDETILTDDDKSVTNVHPMNVNSPGEHSLTDKDNMSSYVHRVKQRSKESLSSESSNNPKASKNKEIPPKGVDKSTKPKQVSENQQESRAMFSALARLCGYDLDLLTEDIRGALNQAERLMRDRGYKPADVDAFGEWWYLHDWRGKQNQAPDLSLIRKTWGQFRKSQKEDKLAAPPDLSPAPDLPECESTWERAGRILRGNRMTSDTFDSLLRDAQPIPHENGTFTLAVRSSAKVWIENRNLKPVILAALKEVKPEIHGLDFEELAQ